MKKRILILTSVASMILQFNMAIIRLLKDKGYEVEVACNFIAGSTCTKEYIDLLKKELADMDVSFYQIDFNRNPFCLNKTLKAYKQVKDLFKKNHYDVMHCHSPIGGMIGRLVARKYRKTGTTVIYTAHGFHFYKGAPKLNWMVYYPIEKFCSRFTDKLITINHEDFNLAKTKFHAKEVHYVPGVGIDLSRFENVQADRAAKRREIGVPEDAFLILSVGELNENKNHQVIIRSIAELKDINDVHYAIVGIGENKDFLSNLAQELGVSERLHLLGYRKDIAELNHISDAFCFPSYREGLGLGAIEAMACGSPIITSNVHGINDYSIDGVTGYKRSPNDFAGFADAILKLYGDRNMCVQFGEYNKALAGKYDVNVILKIMMEKIYEC